MRERVHRIEAKKKNTQHTSKNLPQFLSVQKLMPSILWIHERVHTAKCFDEHKVKKL